MSEQVKSNKEVLNETPVVENVDSSAFDSQAAPASTIPEGQIDNSDNSAGQKIVDTSGMPTDSIKFDDFENLMKGVDSLAASKTEDKVDKKEDPKVEASKVTEATKQESTREERPTGSRDYSDFTKEEVDCLKRMSNQAFSYVAPKLKEIKSIGKIISEKDNLIAQLKTGKQILPEQYYEHPQAFVLTKEFNDGATELNKATAIQNHWRQQFANIRKGEPWYDLNRDEKGNLVVGREKKVADADAEATVQELLYSSVNQTKDIQTYVNNISNNFKQKHTQAVDALKKAEKDNFAVYEDPKHPYQPVIKSVLQNIPAEFRSNPLASLLAKSVAAAVQFAAALKLKDAEIAELKKTGKVTTNTPSDKQILAGPTKDNSSANGGGGKVENTLGNDIADFEKAMV